MHIGNVRLPPTQALPGARRIHNLTEGGICERCHPRCVSDWNEKPFLTSRFHFRVEYKTTSSRADIDHTLHPRSNRVASTDSHRHPSPAYTHSIPIWPDNGTSITRPRLWQYRLPPFSPDNRQLVLPHTHLHVELQRRDINLHQRLHKQVDRGRRWRWRRWIGVL